MWRLESHLQEGTAIRRQVRGRAYETVDELLGDNAVDAVVVCTNTASHFDMARRALLAGKHVLLEKPLCAQATQIRELAEIARS